MLVSFLSVIIMVMPFVVMVVSVAFLVRRLLLAARGKRNSGRCNHGEQQDSPPGSD